MTVIEGNQAQQGLFDNSAKKLFTVVLKLSYQFSNVFTTKDDIKRTLMIEDWELGELYWKCLRKANCIFYAVPIWVPNLLNFMIRD